MTGEKIEEKGKEAEEEFKKWLDGQEVPYIYLEQSMETFSTALQKYDIKRPDFIISLFPFGLIFVDVKCKNFLEKPKQFPLDYDETIKYSRLESIFTMRVWYALSNKESKYLTWFWIPVAEILKEHSLGKLTVRDSSTGGKYFGVPVKKFIPIATARETLGKLFSI